MIAGSAGVEWLDADEAELVEIKTLDEHLDRSHRVILGHVVIKRRWKQCALIAIQPLNKELHHIPRKSSGILSRESPQTERFHTAWAHGGIHGLRPGGPLSGGAPAADCSWRVKSTISAAHIVGAGDLAERFLFGVDALDRLAPLVGREHQLPAERDAVGDWIDSRSKPGRRGIKAPAL